MKTYSPKPEHIVRRWYVIDASGLVLGRLASEVAAILRGKHKPIFAPHMDVGDNVIVINASQIEMTGGKEAKKISYRHSGYPGGITGTRYDTLLADQARMGDREGRARDASEEQPRPFDDQEAARRPRCRAPAPGAAAGAVHARPAARLGGPAREAAPADAQGEQGDDRADPRQAGRRRSPPPSRRRRPRARRSRRPRSRRRRSPTARKTTASAKTTAKKTTAKKTTARKSTARRTTTKKNEEES